MAKIELYKNKINNMSNIIDNVRAEVSGYALALTGLYSKFLAINSSVVDNVISSLSTATKIQEEQISGLNATQRQIEAFVLIAQVTDNRVASCIRELTKMYEAVYNYSHDGSTDIATDSLAEWLYKNWGDRFTYGYVLYNGDDLENMSQEEFDKYVERLLALDYNSLSVEDETRIRGLENFLISNKTNSYINEVVYFHELLNGEIDIRCINKSAWTDLSVERYTNTKYLVCCGWSDILISKFFTDRIKCFSTVEAESSFPDFEESECIRQGNFELCNLSIAHNQAGDANFTFAARQRPAAPCEGAVIVYDSRGNIINYKKLNRYQRPVNLMDFIGTAYNEFKGKDYAETHVEVTIPQGGFVEITDDPYIMETIPLILETQQMVISGQESLEYAQSLSDGAPDLTKSTDSFAAAFDIANAIVNLIHDKEADLWSQEQKNSGSFVLYNYK